VTENPTGPEPAPEPAPDVHTRVSVRQIADLLAWARRLAEQPLNVDPRERAAFQQAKTELLSRINNKGSNHITGLDSNLDHDHPTEGGGV
jgi:hypothetical protein